MPCLCYFKNGALDKTMPCYEKRTSNYGALTQQEREDKYNVSGYTLTELSNKEYNDLLKTTLTLPEAKTLKLQQIEERYFAIQNITFISINFLIKMPLKYQDNQQKLTSFNDYKDQLKIALIEGQASIMFLNQFTGALIQGTFPKFMWQAVDHKICTITDLSADQMSGQAISQINFLKKQALLLQLNNASDVSSVNNIDVEMSLQEPMPINMDNVCEALYQDVDTPQEDKDWLFTKREEILDENQQPTGTFKYNLFTTLSL